MLGNAAIKLQIVGVNNWLYEGELCVFYEHGQRPAQHNFATDVSELFRQVAAGAGSPTCGHDNGCNLWHKFLLPESMIALTHDPEMWEPVFGKEWLSSLCPFGDTAILTMNNLLQCSTCALCQNG
jgi:hypothetical protein